MLFSLILLIVPELKVLEARPKLISPDDKVLNTETSLSLNSRGYDFSRFFLKYS